jgi:glycosyltransferase involved in cell wall biosynthesis
MLSFPVLAKKKVIELFEKTGYDVINTHFAIPTGPLGVWASRKYKVPNVLSLHGGDIYDPSKSLSPHRIFILRKYVRRILNRSTLLVAQSRNTRDNTLRIYNYPDEIKIVPLGFTPLAFPEVTREELSLDKENLYLISIGRLIKRKGFEYLIRALNGLPERVQLILVGDGPLKEPLMKLAGELNLSQRIVFTGRAEDEKKLKLLKASDLYVLSSLHEGYGIVLQEAMEAGLPIVSTNYGGQTDFLKEGENALLVPPKDVGALREAIEKMVENPDLRKSIARNNKEEIKNHYIEKIAAEYIRIFQECPKV